MSRAEIGILPSCMSLGCTKAISSIMSSSLRSTPQTRPSKSLRVTSRYCDAVKGILPGEAVQRAGLAEIDKYAVSARRARHAEEKRRAPERPLRYGGLTMLG